MSEAPCRCNPWAEGLLICHVCQDTRRVALGERADGSRSCPYCGTAEQFAALFRERHAWKIPDLEEVKRTLTTEERAELAASAALHPRAHELTRLSWIEGRRYNPRDDGAFLRRCARELRKAHFLHGQPGDPVGAVEIEAKIGKDGPCEALPTEAPR